MTIVEQCHVCGGEASLIREPTEVVVGHRAVVIEAERMRCSECGAEFYLPGQMQVEQAAAVAKIRSEDKLIDVQEIISTRKNLGLTQAEMERLLGVGPKTVVRWERGTVFQSNATDKLLRVIANVPGAAEYLAHLHGVQLRLTSNRPAVPDPIVPSAATPMELQEAPVAPRVFGNQVLHMEDYRRRKADMQPIPADLLRKAQL